MSGREQLGPYTLTWPDGVFPFAVILPVNFSYMFICIS